jgi:hypothetical protein
MLSSVELARLQREQHTHDLRNHFDIISRSKSDRLKHYGLHFAKYVGRLARESAEPKPVDQTLTDAFLVGLSAANTLHQDLSRESFKEPGNSQIDPLRVIADAAGRFADACEKIDHYEEGRFIALSANHDLLQWTMTTADQRKFDLQAAVGHRRKELAARQFYIED